MSPASEKTPDRSAAYRPQAPAVLAATALLLVLGLGYVASRHKAAQDAILARQRQHLKIEMALARIERQILLARNAESALLLGGGAEPVQDFHEQMRKIEEGWRTLEATPRFSRSAGELAIVQATTDRYLSAVRSVVRISRRLGRTGEPGLLDELQATEKSLNALFQRLSDPALSLRFADLKLRELQFSNSLNTGHAEELLRDTEALAKTIQGSPPSSIRDSLLDDLNSYRATVSKTMARVLELELAMSQSSLRFSRISPEVRNLENHLDESVRSAAKELDARRRASLYQTILLIVGVFLAFLFLMVFEARRARAWIDLESRLLQAQKAESLGVLTGGIAHDFNNLLVGILGNASLVLDRLPANSDARRHLEKVKTAGSRAAELVGQMLAYAGRGSFLFEVCNLSGIVEEMAQLLETAIARSNHLQLSLATDLPLVEVDVTQIRQVVMNLITNASDALDDQEGTISVRTGIEQISESQVIFGNPLTPGKYVFVEVEDDGRGMDEATRLRLFEPFFSSKARGRGLGMAAVLGIARTHKGAMRVRSKVGQGSTFRLLLPSTSKPLKDRAREKLAPLPPLVGGKRMVLVVDDDETHRFVAQVTLEMSSFQVLLAEDGRSAVELYTRRADEVDVVLLDLTMPGISAQQTLRELRQIRPEVKVLVCSAQPEREFGRHFQGLAGYIEKPYLPDQLVQKVLEALGERKRSTEAATMVPS